MQKSADAFRTISEVADDLSLPQHVLRFWETRFPQIRPLKRAGGRRYYRPNDVSLLRAIRQLLYDDGYTIKGVQRLLKEQGPRDLAARDSSARDLSARDLSARDLSARDLDTGGRPADDAGISPDLPGLADDDLGEDLPTEPIASGEDTVPPTADGLLAYDRDLVMDALTTIEDCKRILDALLHLQR